MPRRGREKITLVRGSEKAMEAFSMEIAKELGLYEKISNEGFNGLTTFEAGQLGGTSTRIIQAMGEQLIMERYNKGEDKLIPDELQPNRGLMRDMTNNGNVVKEGRIMDTKHKEIKDIITNDPPSSNYNTSRPFERAGQLHDVDHIQ